MKLFVVDESSTTWDEKIDFFIYGGIVIDESEALSLAMGVLAIKEKFDIQNERPIKWTNNTWNGQPVFDKETHAEIKDEILTLFTESSSKIIVCLSPHIFYHCAEKKDDDTIRMKSEKDNLIRTYKYGLNDAISNFNSLLGDNDWGIVLADRFDQAVKKEIDVHCKEMFTKKPRILHPVIQLENEDSLLHQINDVVLGAIFYSLREMETNQLTRLKDNFWCNKDGENEIVGFGFDVYPKMAKASHIAIPKKRLISKFKRLTNDI